ncbi:MAG: hypothetical protein LBJ99_02035 [Oscillospiraceae bacterium]|jgi:hypothetical protein|nr:hypothetical protein [Oscillospiraceae bacterium]
MVSGFGRANKAAGRRERIMSHTHEHEHTGGHTHEHSHGAGGANAVKDAALLKYMLEHNRSHAQEQHDTGHKLADAGFGYVSGLVHDAVHHFEHGNALLSEALELLEARVKPEGGI